MDLTQLLSKSSPHKNIEEIGLHVYQRQVITKSKYRNRGADHEIAFLSPPQNQLKPKPPGYVKVAQG